MQHGEVVLRCQFLRALDEAAAIARARSLDGDLNADGLDASAENLNGTSGVVDGESHDISKGMIDS